MMILCKTFNTWLGFPDPIRRCRNIPTQESSGLRCVIEERPAAPLPPPQQPKSPDRGGDPGAWGLHDAGGGPGRCTESLGSESCDDAPAEDQLEIAAARSPRISRRKSRSAARKFPPPLPWLAGSGGRRSCYMKGERRDGRFVLTEVKIERPEVLRASRQNGRLRLQLVEESDGSDEVENQEEEKAEDVVSSPVPMMRCQEVVVGGGDGSMPMWWSHRCITTA